MTEDVLMASLPPTLLADLEREPVLYNSHLGHYTNFVNFFGLSALAVTRPIASASA